eukprot:3437494-Rhodomonas_salina.1
MFKSPAQPVPIVVDFHGQSSAQSVPIVVFFMVKGLAQPVRHRHRRRHWRHHHHHHHHHHHQCQRDTSSILAIDTVVSLRRQHNRLGSAGGEGTEERCSGREGASVVFAMRLAFANMFDKSSKLRRGWVRV